MKSVRNTGGEAGATYRLETIMYHSTSLVCTGYVQAQTRQHRFCIRVRRGSLAKFIKDCQDDDLENQASLEPSAQRPSPSNSVHLTSKRFEKSLVSSNASEGVTAHGSDEQA